MAELNSGDNPVVSGGGIKSIQRLSLSGSGTKTISPVDPNKTTINNLSSAIGVACGDSRGVSMASTGTVVYVKLVDSTTISHNCMVPKTQRSNDIFSPPIVAATFDIEVIEYN